MTDLQKWRNEIERLKGKQNHLHFQLNNNRKKAKKTKILLKRIESAQTIIQTVAQLTQKQLEYRISELVTLSMRAIFQEPYELKLKFEPKRGKTEARLLFIRDGEEFDPLSSAGGGPTDVASFSLRVALWSLKRPKSRNTLVLDEPFRFLSRDLQPKASDMLKQISKKLGLQIIMVSHSEDLIEEADRIFRVHKRKKQSIVKREEE